MSHPTFSVSVETDESLNEDDLEYVVAVLKRNDDEILCKFNNALEKYIKHSFMSFEAACGLKNDWRKGDVSERDVAICKLGELLDPKLSDYKKAAQICEWLEIYKTEQWPVYQSRSKMQAPNDEAKIKEDWLAYSARQMTTIQNSFICFRFFISIKKILNIKLIWE